MFWVPDELLYAIGGKPKGNLPFLPGYSSACMYRVFHKICHDFNCTWWYHITCKHVFFTPRDSTCLGDFYGVFGITLRPEAAE